ncbi:hypothetical protein GCM10009754_64710 [Amycolatopsis minnesotensis]|uniref:Uncharacterized protein n=1 Tax=Amycolatopsis minnesotensis TaxID=337894 RepID=A0ABP5DG14_9PSEU
MPIIEIRIVTDQVARGQNGHRDTVGVGALRVIHRIVLCTPEAAATPFAGIAPAANEGYPR